MKSLGLPTHTGRAVMSYSEVAEIMGISRSRVMQIEIRALVKIRRAIQCEAAAAGETVGEWLFGDG